MDQKSLMEKVLAMSRAIEHAAQMADWIEVQRLVDARSPHLMSIAPEQTPETLALIRNVQAIDAAVCTAARDAQAGLQVEYRAAMNRLNAANAYQAAAAQF
ncbi:flagellar protein FliT [Burkholderia savannae]|uniref:flagellar protein FliT n=1 Tax=Burkholderia savannae TaxID=1637837 RepID=UPI00075BF92B|nr:flagellar protein FliT [Burkholderia savannae]AOJ79411.1 flagellar protein FliT [Burkholderia savannae]